MKGAARPTHPRTGGFIALVVLLMSPRRALGRCDVAGVAGVGRILQDACGTGALFPLRFGGLSWIEAGLPAVRYDAEDLRLENAIGRLQR